MDNVARRSFHLLTNQVGSTIETFLLDKQFCFSLRKKETIVPPENTKTIINERTYLLASIQPSGFFSVWIPRFRRATIGWNLTETLK